jgi:hypothetical protein
VLDGELRPVMEDAVRGGARTALQLGLDGPGKLGALVFLQDEVYAQRVQILRVKEETVHVEKASPHGRETVIGHGQSTCSTCFNATFAGDFQPGLCPFGVGAEYQQ